MRAFFKVLFVFLSLGLVSAGLALLPSWRLSLRWGVPFMEIYLICWALVLGVLVIAAVCALWWVERSNDVTKFR